MTRQSIVKGILSLTLCALPASAFAAQSFAQLVNGPVMKLGDQLILLIYALCFIVFLIGIVQNFFSQNVETRQKGRMFAIYGIVGLVVLYVAWGLVNFMLGILTSFTT